MLLEDTCAFELEALFFPLDTLRVKASLLHRFEHFPTNFFTPVPRKTKAL
ncbi:MAG TPA: hypothetical protein VIY29_20465 [Ktedonobacteraceae bacterium]